MQYLCGSLPDGLGRHPLREQIIYRFLKSYRVLSLGQTVPHLIGHQTHIEQAKVKRIKAFINGGTGAESPGAEQGWVDRKDVGKARLRVLLHLRQRPLPGKVIADGFCECWGIPTKLAIGSD